MNYIILMFVIIIFLVLIYLKTYKAGKENLTECLDINDKLKNISNIINRLQNPYKKTPINNKKRNKLSQEYYFNVLKIQEYNHFKINGDVNEITQLLLKYDGKSYLTDKEYKHIIYVFRTYKEEIDKQIINNKKALKNPLKCLHIGIGHYVNYISFHIKKIFHIKTETNLYKIFIFLFTVLSSLKGLYDSVHFLMQFIN